MKFILNLEEIIKATWLNWCEKGQVIAILSQVQYNLVELGFRF